MPTSLNGLRIVQLFCLNCTTLLNSDIEGQKSAVTYDIKGGVKFHFKILKDSWNIGKKLQGVTFLLHLVYVYTYIIYTRVCIYTYVCVCIYNLLYIHLTILLFKLFTIECAICV